jgi:hypothetical protein
MNSKTEKYYQYVLDGILKDTELDYEDDRLIIRFGDSYETFLMPVVFQILANKWAPWKFFVDHVQSKYGMRDNEIHVLWLRYMKLIKEMWKNYWVR